MLRGLDACGAARSDHQPPVVTVAGREPLPVTVTVYVHERPGPDCQRRFERLLDHLALLDEAGLVRGVRAVTWPARVDTAGDDDGAVRALLGAFAAAAGAEALAPFFDRGPDGLAVPGLAIVLRRAGTITDLYPRLTADGVASVDTGLERLVAGEDLEGLAADADGVPPAATAAGESGVASESDRSTRADTPSRADSRSEPHPGGDTGDCEEPTGQRRESDGPPLTPP